MQRLTKARHWVFDLDNTLYPPECDLFAQIDRKMTGFVAEFLEIDPIEARRLQKQYYVEHGTTLNGLMQNHGIHPKTFLDHVHDIDHSVLPHNPDLRIAIERLPGDKIIFTNGSEDHARNVLDASGLGGVFEQVIDIQATSFAPKPQQSAYDHLISACQIDPDRSVFFEDLARNLEPAHQMGFMTVLIRSEKDWSHEPAAARPAGVDEDHDHVHFAVDNLTNFLNKIPF